MRLLFWRRKKSDTPTPTPVEPQPRGAIATAPRPGGSSGRLAPIVEPRDELLRFARDVLNARGDRVRVEEDDLILATQNDGAVARYTTTLARARAEEQTTLLAQGATALESLFDEASDRARLVGVRLAADADPVALAMRHLAPTPEACGRCAGRAGEGWLAGAPHCDSCPLRAERPALTWEQPPATARILKRSEAQSVELVYRLIAHDRRGRHDEWLRLAFDCLHGRELPPLPIDLLSAAQPSETSWAREATLAEASVRAQARLRPAMEALSAALQLRVAEEYQQRIADVTTTHERLRRERPDDGVSVAAALERELASLAEVYGVEVEARLESVVLVISPMAQVAIDTEGGVGPTVMVDTGRGVVSPPVCSVCAGDVSAGHVCAHGHAICAEHADACVHCGTLRCPACEPAALARCTLCGDATCGEHLSACDACNRAFCADHIWRCVEGDTTLCLEHLRVCASCGDPLCEAHASACAVCGDTTCQRHTRRCKTCGEARCETHALACGTCGQPVCSAHATTCEECGKATCQDDIFTCLGCGRALCACAGMAACVTCGADYCAHCRGETGACPACRAPSALSEADTQALRLVAERETSINLKQKWQVGHNALARVFIAKGLGREQVWVVTHEGEIAGARRKGWLAR